MNTVLIIDDDANIRHIFDLVLQHHGFKVLLASNGSEGLEIARRERPDLILSDVVMPGVDGETVLQSIRHDPDLCHKQVVMMTGYPEALPARRGMEIGADDFLLKPVRLDALIRCVEARLSRALVLGRAEDRMLEQLRSTMHNVMPLEFSTPVNGIIGLSQMLRAEMRKLTPDEIEDALVDISNTALRLQRTQRNYLMILDFPVTSPPAFSFADLLEPELVKQSILAGIEATVKRTRRKTDMVIKIDPSPLAICAADLSLIVEELVDNACNYSINGTPVTVQLGADGILTITDTGRGLSPEEVKQIGLFQQFDHQKPIRSGLGLGLVLVQKLIAKWDATFSLESQLSVGTTAKVVFQTEKKTG